MLITAEPFLLAPEYSPDFGWGGLGLGRQGWATQAFSLLYDNQCPKRNIFHDELQCDINNTFNQNSGFMNQN